MLASKKKSMQIIGIRCDKKYTKTKKREEISVLQTHVISLFIGRKNVSKVRLACHVASKRACCTWYARAVIGSRYLSASHALIRAALMSRRAWFTVSRLSSVPSPSPCSAPSSMMALESFLSKAHSCEDSTLRSIRTWNHGDFMRYLSHRCRQIP